MSKPNGWQTHDAAILSGKLSSYVAPEISEFDRLIEQYGVSEENVTDSLLMREWIRKNYLHRFVPERVLKRMGLDITEVMLGFRDERGISKSGRVAPRTGVLQRES